MAYAKREDALAALKRHYNLKKEYYLQKNIRRRKELIEWLLALKLDKPCLDCKKVFHPVAMDFDHRNGKDKFQSISLMIQQGYSKERILAEIAKCDLVCSNCHRVRTFNRLHSAFV